MNQLHKRILDLDVTVEEWKEFKELAEYRKEFFSTDKSTTEEIKDYG